VSGALLDYGLIGAFTAAKSGDRATLLHTKSGDTVFFTIEGLSEPELLGMISPWLRSAGIPVASRLDSPAPATAPTSVADELKKLADLRDAGALTDDEFCSAKAKLLDQPS
jgi:hypothetical protein